MKRNRKKSYVERVLHRQLIEADRIFIDKAFDAIAGLFLILAFEGFLFAMFLM